MERRLIAEAEREPEIPVALRQAWPVDGVEIEFVIRTTKAMPPAIYALVARWRRAPQKWKRCFDGRR